MVQLSLPAAAFKANYFLNLNVNSRLLQVEKLLIIVLFPKLFKKLRVETNCGIENNKRNASI